MSGNDFVKGRTNNHLTWVMVDATDFATPESALSAATKIKIYGKLRGGTGANFVSSGTGSLTNDIQHVGASALGIYTIALVKADLSDASAAWYDQYIISLSATGAAYQTLVVDGGIDASALSALQSRLSDMQSYLVALSGLTSDVQSAVAVGNSRVLIAQSGASDAASAAAQANSRVLLVQSRLSDLDSRLASDVSDLYSLLSDLNSNILSRVPKEVASKSLLSDVHSDLASKIGGITVTIGASDISDIASAVVAGLPVVSAVSDIYSMLTRVDSRVLVIQSLASDAHSAAILAASHASDAHSAANVGASRALVIQSRLSDLDSRLASEVSDIYSLLSDVQSDFQSRVPKRVATDSQLSAMTSDVLSALAAGVPLDASSLSDIRSAVLSLSGAISDAHSAATQASSRALVTQSHASDIYSLLSDLHSDVGVLSGVQSDIYSNLAAGVTVGASSLSDVASAVWATARTEPTTVVSPTGTMKTGMEWLVALSRNKITQTATVQSLRNDADSADIASAAVSDDGTTFTRAEFGN